jgi:hypothetical protein
MDALNADIYSRPNYLNGEYRKAGVIAKTEEQFPATLAERIPGAGRVFKASEMAFRGSGLRMRTDLYDMLSKQAKENGVKWNDVQIADIGTLVNSMTARGKWSKRGESSVVRIILWAPKMLKANIDFLTAHYGGAGLETAFARKQAAINLLKVVAETATIMMIANAIRPGSAEYNPQSSDFGKIKVGQTRFDITGGMASIVTLASRIATGARKDSRTGNIKKYGTGYGQPTALSALLDFLMNKNSPPAAVARDWLRGSHFGGEPFSWKKSASNATTPISVQNSIQAYKDPQAEVIAGAIVDFVGINANTYD